MSGKTKNVLFIMCDQLRYDYLSCAGHPRLHTPNIDRIAARGVRFSRAYAQSTICGPARMSAYTGRYMRSHGSTWNGVPLRIGEPTLGDLGRLLDFLDAEGLTETTAIVFTADHGDYLGDHWLGEKYLFHDASSRVPLIIADPDPRADATRGSAVEALVEHIDLAPTFLDWLGGAPKPHVLEGRSLTPWLYGETPATWRDAVFSEYDFSMDPARIKLGASPAHAVMTMVFDGRFKAVFAEGFRPMLHDLESDPQECVDFGADPAHAETLARLERRLLTWYRHARSRVTLRDEDVTADDAHALAFDAMIPAGILIGYWDETELAEEKRKRDAALRNERDPGARP